MLNLLTIVCQAVASIAITGLGLQLVLTLLDRLLS